MVKIRDRVRRLEGMVIVAVIMAMVCLIWSALHDEFHSEGIILDQSNCTNETRWVSAREASGKESCVEYTQRTGYGCSDSYSSETIYRCTEVVIKP